MLAPTSVRHARLITARADGARGVVVFEFIDGEQGDVLRGCDPPTSRDIVESIAGLHATWWGDTDLPGVPPLAPGLRASLMGEQIDRCIADHHDVLPRSAQLVIRALPRPGRYCSPAWSPPSTWSCTPVVKRACSLHRKATT